MNLAEVHLRLGDDAGAALRALSGELRRAPRATVSVPLGHERSIGPRLRGRATVRVPAELETIQTVVARGHQAEVECGVDAAAALVPALSPLAAHVLFNFGDDASDLGLLPAPADGGAGVRIRGQVMTRELLRAHPCNAYLCAGARCHSSKSPFPRELVVRSDGSVQPYGITDDLLTLGRSSDANLAQLLQKYEGSPAHEAFLELNRQAYLDNVVSGLFTAKCWRGVLAEQARRREQAHVAGQ